MVALIAVVIIAAVAFIGKSASNQFSTVGSAVDAPAKVSGLLIPKTGWSTRYERAGRESIGRHGGWAPSRTEVTAPRSGSRPSERKQGLEGRR